jgi:hypothetical protein
MRIPTSIAAVCAIAAIATGLALWPAGPDGSAREASPSAQAADTTDATGDTLSAAERAIRAHNTADRGPIQPVPFSHRFHVQEIQIECQYCHVADESQMATMPALSVCMGCHQYVGGGLPAIDTLRGYWERDEPVPWQRIYKVAEFVQFNHLAHVRSGVQCEECHGPVEEMDRVYKYSSLGMGWCLECHRQQPPETQVASGYEYKTTYDLAREVTVPEFPEGRQPVGLYPRAISSGYAAARAPDDCATCHY